MKSNSVYFETKTTGLDTKTDRLVFLYAVDSNGVELKVACNPERDMSSEVEILNNTTNETVKAYPTLIHYKDMIENYFKEREDYNLVSHSLKTFHLPILLNELTRVGVSKEGILKMEQFDVRELEIILTSHSLAATFERHTGKELVKGIKSEVSAIKDIFHSQINNPKISKEGYYIFDKAGMMEVSGNNVTWRVGKLKGESIFKDMNYLEWYVKEVDSSEEMKNKIKAAYLKVNENNQQK